MTMDIFKVLTLRELALYQADDWQAFDAEVRKRGMYDLARHEMAKGLRLMELSQKLARRAYYRDLGCSEIVVNILAGEL